MVTAIIDPIRERIRESIYARSDLGPRRTKAAEEQLDRAFERPELVEYLLMLALLKRPKEILPDFRA
jgi:hypothetical protein